MRDLLSVWINHDRLVPGFELSGAVELSKFDDWPADESSVHLTLEIVQAPSGRLALQGQLQGRSEMICQRCLQPMNVDWEGEFNLELVESQAQAERIDTALDIYVMEGGRLELHELARSESLLVLPMSARHPEGQCEPPEA